MTTTISEVLRAARAKIERPENWTQGAAALSRERRKVTARDPDAVCWCAEGAMEAVGAPWDIREAAYDALRPAMDGNFIYKFNDTHTHAEVLAAFDNAIALAEARP